MFIHVLALVPRSTQCTEAHLGSQWKLGVLGAGKEISNACQAVLCFGMKTCEETQRVLYQQAEVRNTQAEDPQY